jgi:hypothetical protein
MDLLQRKIVSSSDSLIRQKN